MRRNRPGDGRALTPLRWWQILTRTVFFHEAVGADGATAQYAVDVRHLAGEIDEKAEGDPAPPVALYRDGTQLYRANLPATFPVPGGVIEVAVSMYGLSRMHVVPERGEERTLRPHPRSLEGLRARFDARHPAASRVIGAAAVVVLLVSLALTIPQILELVTMTEIVAERVGTFTSPITLPAWANIALVLAGALAATERALTLRSHWLIDADTTWTNFT